MERSDTGTIDELLQRWAEGDAAALDRLLPIVYADLRRLARRVLRAAPGQETLQTTALLHDAMLRLLGRAPGSFEGPMHLMNACARMMRQVLVDRARRAQRDKRGGRWIRAEAGELAELPIPDGTELLALEQALEQLEQLQPRMAEVLELRYFMGLEMQEIAAALSLSERTVGRDWVAARAWLKTRLDGSD